MKTIDMSERPARPALFALLFIAVLGGAMAGFAASRHLAPPLAWGNTLDLLFGFLCFVWYCRDGDARSFNRSRWLSVAMVSVTLLAIPYYLWRSRPRGQRRRAIMRYLGFGVLL
jgi:hypothetical protein